MLLYHLLWTCLCAPVLPLCRMAGRSRWRQRLALDMPPGPPVRASVWIHALSVGEVLSAMPLVEAVKRRYPERDIVFSASTEKGIGIARESLGQAGILVATMPVDFWWSVERVFRYLGPRLFILVETDLWPGLLDRLQQQGVASILVNGRVSPRSYRAYRRLPGLGRRTYGKLAACLMQTDLDRRRLIRSGIKADRVLTAGNIKYDRQWVSMGGEERRQWASRLGLDPGAPVVVAGSTHEGEEQILLGAFARLAEWRSDLRLIVAPRQVERAAAIVAHARSRGFKTVRRSALPAAGDYQVLVLDTLGELGRVYGLAAVSFVGGSLVPFGGHNLLEPASFGIPVLYGPYTHNFEEMAAAMERLDAGRRVRDEASLLAALRDLLSQDKERLSVGRRARDFVFQNQGALERVMAVVSQHLDGSAEEGQ